MTVRSIGRGIQYQFMDKKTQLLANESLQGEGIGERGNGPASGFPAPWRIEGNFDAEVSVVIYSDDNECVCEIEPFLEEWTEAEIARVRLIAAAPELLDACTTTLAFLDKLEANSDPRDGLSEIRRKVHAPLRAKLAPAIAKAAAQSNAETGATGQPNNQKRY